MCASPISSSRSASAGIAAQRARVKTLREKLAKINSQRADFVVLRFFGGLTVDEAAEAIGVSRRTAMREWKVAKSWLRRELSAA